MKKIILATLLVGISAPAFAASGGFGGGFANGLANSIEMGSAMEQADAAKQQAEASSPVGQCLAMQTGRIMRRRRCQQRALFIRKWMRPAPIAKKRSAANLTQGTRP
jgi:hypothetical protein